MCEQCLAETILLNDQKEVLSNFFLVQATKDGNAMKNGQYGLVIQNDPSFIFTVKPEPDPDPNDDKPDTPEENQKMWDWFQKSETFGEDLMDSARNLRHVHKLVQSCYDAGYTDEDGSLEQWLFNYLSRFV